MDGLIEVHVLPSPKGQPYQPATGGVRLLGLDNQGRLWCGVLMGEAGLSPTVRWTRVTDSN
jgi:hypothetical protein